MSKTLLDSEGLKLYDRLIKQYIANNAGGGSGGSSGGSGDGIPRNGNRGVLAGYEQIVITNIAEWDMSLTVTPDSPDVSFAFFIDIPNPDDSWIATEGEDMVMGHMVKLIYVMEGSAVTLGDRWVWQNEEVPVFGAYGVLIAQFFPSMIGVVSYVPLF